MYTEIHNLIEMLQKSGKVYDFEKIKKAYLFAKELHEGQFRVSGDPYIIHPISVAEIVAGLGLDTDSICAAFLHDVLEDCGEKVDNETILKEFGPQVEMLVDGLTKLVQIPFEDKEEAHIENLRKMFLAMSKDIRVIFIKLCDRLHNMRTLGVKKDEKRRITALETMQVYAPLAHRLGMQRIKQELENLALGYLDPIGCEEVQKDIEKKYGQNKDFIEKAKAHVSEKLEKNSIKYSLEGRVKSVYSIYKKMYNQNKSFDEIYDFYALRIIVETELECYTVLGVIHEAFKSIPGRFKDYISTPKPNMYRSLHTTVIGRDGIPFEVQIRTREMHHIAEYGVAAHWKYKSGETSSKEDIDEKLSWIAKLIETDEDVRDSDEFLRALKIDIFHDETFVFTPKGDVIALPQGATLIDFAYSIHSAVGNKMIGAKINGAITPIDSVPKTGDIVEILTSSASRGPSRDWLKVVKTGEARNKIRQWFKREKRSENIIVGKVEIDKEFRRYTRSCTEQQRNEIIMNIAKRLGVQSVDDFYNTIGYGGIIVSKISGKLKDEFDRVVKPEITEQVIENDNIASSVQIVHKSDHKKSGVIIDGVDGCMVKFAKCCNPIPGDDIIGFITKGFGISVHKTDCPNVLTSLKASKENDRWISASWGVAEDQNRDMFEAQIQLYTNNRIGMLADISSALADMKVPILQINSQKKSEDVVVINLSVECKNLDHFNLIVSRLRTISGVEEVRRAYN